MRTQLAERSDIKRDFVALFQRFAEALRERLLRRSRPGLDPSEVVQDLAVAVWTNPQSIPDDPTEQRNMLLAAASRVVWRHEQRARRAAKTSAPVDAVEGLGPRDMEASLHRWLIALEALNKLPKDYRDVLVGHDIHGRSLEDLAIGMGKKTTSMENLLWKARMSFDKQRRDLEAEEPRIKDENESSRGLLVLPLGLTFLTAMEREVLGAMLDAEELGGPAGPPPPPPSRPLSRLAPALIPLPVGPKLIAGLIGGLVTLPIAGLILFYLLSHLPKRPELARGGLIVPPVVVELVGQCRAQAMDAPHIDAGSTMGALDTPTIRSPAENLSDAARLAMRKGRPRFARPAEEGAR